MPLTWDVQPYRHLQDMRDAYARHMFTAVNRNANKFADDIRSWAKANAPWQDRTIEERVDAYLTRAGKRKGVDDNSGGFVPNHYLHGARVMLRVYPHVEEVVRVTNIYDAEILAAPQRNRAWVENTNAERKARGLGPLKKFPKSRTAENIAWKKYRRDLPPLIEITIEHDPRLHYAIWLEVAHGGKYNIIKRTIEHWMPKMMNEIRSLANLKQYQSRQGFVPNTPTEKERFESFVAEREADTGKKYTPWSQEVKDKREARRRKEYTPEIRRQKREERRHATERRQESARIAQEELDRQNRLAALKATATSTNERRAIEQRFWDEERRKQIQKGKEEAQRRSQESKSSK